MEKLWSKTEITHLKRYAGKQSLEELAQRFHTDSEAVRRKIEELGLVGAAEAAEHADRRHQALRGRTCGSSSPMSGARPKPTWPR